MKKIILLLLIFSVLALPAIAIDTNSQLQQEEFKYQQKIQKIKEKQAIKCAKHPEICVSPVKEQNLTLGVVQKEVKVGSSQADVALALGSPNIVTNDDNEKETWIYDKIASVTSYNSSGFKVGIGGFGGGGATNGLGGGVLGIGYGSVRGNAQTNNKTLTVVIKFNKSNKVESLNYHMSNF